ncbi:hypothetical protein A1O7_08365 [Cladophialophora yegresii CBS 114405]|uniref:Uncharacterized protein n=1 Tax=Cladophialophora yegresii CBS 114405 TaxID=1182544 RepID=W9VIX5_9EURO|nr:uncharacterized protein A1O7_08365 [Cladophialophora yegresii CBS 114405]EXJ55438.1 hypothetical protein A1O7_08365 [Cladophialophora yegresii CBS 114405]
MSPTPQERFTEASKHATLIRALLAHPSMRLNCEGLPDRSDTPATLYNVADFELSTYKKYLLPILPPDADKNSKALAISKADKVKENPSLLTDDMYPRMNVGGFIEKWQDAIGRTVMITSIILEPRKQILFGGFLTLGRR